MFVDKRAVSQVVTYVLLIITALGLSVLVYAFLQGFIPEEKFICPENLALIIRTVRCDIPLKQGQILVDVSNKGNFEIDGVYARYSQLEGGVASNPLIPIDSEDYGSINRITSDQAAGGFLYFGRLSDVPIPLRPGKNYTQLFSYSGGLKKIEFQPFVNRGGNEELGICENKVVSRVVSCN